jgi:PTS hybrid protein
MAVGLVIVSHSAKLAEGVVELAGQMAQHRATILPAGGAADGSLGTSADRIADAIRRADSGAGVLVLVDLGSAQLSAEVALEMLDRDLRERVRISGAPLVEGAVVAAVEASIGSPLDRVAQAALSAGTSAKTSDSQSTARAEPPAQGAIERATVLLLNRIGLHARPASLFVQTAARFRSNIRVQLGERSADGQRILSLLQLSARCGDTLIVEAQGPDAREAIAALVALAERKFDEE